LYPDRITMYRVDMAGIVYNRFRVQIANRSGKREQVTLAMEGLPGARLVPELGAIATEAGSTVERRFEIAAAPFAGAQDVNHFRISASAVPIREQDNFDETFLMPARRKTP
jgi:IG-like fold at C-terminal of FixG, putative oxidoreductase